MVISKKLKIVRFTSALSQSSISSIKCNKMGFIEVKIFYWEHVPCLPPITVYTQMTEEMSLSDLCPSWCAKVN